MNQSTIRRKFLYRLDDIIVFIYGIIFSLAIFYLVIHFIFWGKPEFFKMQIIFSALGFSLALYLFRKAYARIFKLNEDEDVYLFRYDDDFGDQMLGSREEMERLKNELEIGQDFEIFSRSHSELVELRLKYKESHKYVVSSEYNDVEIARKMLHMIPDELIDKTLLQAISKHFAKEIIRGEQKEGPAISKIINKRLEENSIDYRFYKWQNAYIKLSRKDYSILRGK